MKVSTISLNKAEKELWHVGDTTKRFILSVDGANPLFIIGLNPSTAGNKKGLDHTMSKIVGFIERSKKFDSFIMLNLSAQRTKNPRELTKELNKELHQENLESIKNLIQKSDSINILAVWGNNIKSKPYLSKNLEDILELLKKKKVNWLKIGDKLTVMGHPQHPRNPSYEEGLHRFDIPTYLKASAIGKKSN